MAAKKATPKKVAKKPPKKASKKIVDRSAEILKRLKVLYPVAICELTHETAFQLLSATILSAQCTDARVNMVTPALFAEFPTAQKMAAADVSRVEELVRSTGFYATKAKNLVGMARNVMERFDGEVPSAIEDLVTLPGVGRKTANVVLGHAFDTPGITVDTHFGRLSRRFGWTKETDPVKVEMVVQQLIPQAEWTNLSQRMIWHGRRICHSRKPACGACPVAKICPSVGIGEMNKEKALLLVKTDKDFR
jgi:endonuclease-3